MTRLLMILGSALALIIVLGASHSFAQATYVGSKACADCHEHEYSNFVRYAKKAHSSESVQTMAPKLSQDELKECYTCHTTGYGTPSGFKSFQETPELAHAGCEVCHGPGSMHVEYGGDPTEIKGDLEISDCETCHNPERVASFNYKPLLYGGAH